MSTLQKFTYSIIGWATGTHARIYLGQHYFTDCVFSLLYGLPLGIILEKIYFGTSLGVTFETMNGLVQYSTNRNVPLMIGLVVALLVLALLADVRPMRFWDKGVIFAGFYAAGYSVLLSIPKGAVPPVENFSVLGFMWSGLSNWKVLMLGNVHLVCLMTILVKFKVNKNLRNSWFFRIVFYFISVFIVMWIFLVSYLIM